MNQGSTGWQHSLAITTTGRLAAPGFFKAVRFTRLFGALKSVKIKKEKILPG